MEGERSYAAGIAQAKLTLGSISYYAGENKAAIQHLLPSVALWRELERPFELAAALNRLAGALSAIREYAPSQRAHEECRDIYESLGYRRGVATAIQNLGALAFELGDYARARTLFCDGLRIRQDLGLQRGYAYSFEHIADVDEIEERYEQAVQLLAAANALRVRIGAPGEQINNKENENGLTRLRARLGDVLFELAWSKGATMTNEQAISLALGRVSLRKLALSSGLVIGEKREEPALGFPSPKGSSKCTGVASGWSPILEKARLSGSYYRFELRGKRIRDEQDCFGDRRP